MLNAKAKSLILLFLVLLTSGTGCQVLGIPSYRADTGNLPHGSPYISSDGCDLGIEGEDCSQVSVMPPLPGWLAAWHERKKTPQPAAYPRFQPLPTRPMFSRAPNGIVQNPLGGPYPVENSRTRATYGQLPRENQWNEMQPPATAMVPVPAPVPQTGESLPLPEED